MFKFKIGIPLLISLTLLFSGCQKKIPVADIDEGDFFNIVYLATKTRDIGATEWTPVQGTLETQFISSAENQGTFALSYSLYLEPQFCPFNQNCVCSGGIEGSYFIPEADETTTEAPYNPLDPYVPEGSTGTTTDPTTEKDPQTGLPKVSKIYSFLFNITITNRSLSSGCKPESDRQVKIVRFANGEAIMTNDYREIYLVPSLNR